MTKTAPPIPSLPMQLMLTLGCWMSSPFALQCVKNDWPHWSKRLHSLAPNLPLNELKAAQLEAAITQEAKQRASNLLDGIHRYQQSGYQRHMSEPAVIWQQGSARLLDYTAYIPQHMIAHAPMVLFVPSLINRYYVLDLEKERSMMHYLASQGVHPIILDWGTPSEAQMEYDCAAYIQKIMLPAIDYLHEMSQDRVALAGYCMGGILSMAAAILRPEKVNALALLATPWDFHCDAFAPFIFEESYHPLIMQWLQSKPLIPADMLQMLFYMTNPWVFEQKFRRFSELSPDSRAAKDFIALEHWVNDGIPMTSAVAIDCLIRWSQQNMLSKNAWKVTNRRIAPDKIRCPTFMAIPKNDHVVPFECAMALAKKLPQAELIHPSAGHVGMIVGSRAKRELWQPLAKWLHETRTAA